MKKLKEQLTPIAIIGIILTVIFGILTVYFGKRSVTKDQLPKHELTIDVTNISPMVLNFSEDKDIKVSYENIDVNSLYETTIVISNTGDFAIGEDDFLEPLIMRVNDNVRIVSVSLIYRHFNENTRKNIYFKEDYISINNIIINTGEKIEISILSEDIFKNFNIECNIKNIGNNLILNNKFENHIFPSNNEILNYYYDYNKNLSPVLFVFNSLMGATMALIAYFIFNKVLGSNVKKMKTRLLKIETEYKNLDIDCRDLYKESKKNFNEIKKIEEILDKINN